MERKLNTSKLYSILNQRSESEQLQSRITELETWIAEEGLRNNICTHPILHEPCANCQCFRKNKKMA